MLLLLWQIVTVLVLQLIGFVEARRSLLAQVNGDRVLCQTILRIVVRYEVIHVTVVLRVIDEDLGERLAARLPTRFLILIMLLYRGPTLPLLLWHVVLIFLRCQLIPITYHTFVLGLGLVGRVC